jgi:hypothetical protein
VVVTVARELAADATDRVAERQGRRREIEQPNPEVAPVGGPAEDPDHAADHAAVPDQPRAREEISEQVVLDLVVVLEDEVDARADQAADQSAEAQLVCPVDRSAELVEATPDQRSGRQERDRKGDPERLQGDRTEVDLGVHAASSLDPNASGGWSRLE